MIVCLRVLLENNLGNCNCRSATLFAPTAVRGGVRDHQRRQVVLVELRLGREVGHVSVAALRGLDDYNPHAAHGGARPVGAVRRDRDEAHVAVAVAAGGVVGLGGEEG